MKLDKRRDWGEMAEQAQRHFAKQAYNHELPKTVIGKLARTVSHPSSDTVRNSGTVYSTYSRRDQAIAWNAARS